MGRNMQKTKPGRRENSIYERIPILPLPPSVT
jgi:hypothetical protein